MIVFDQNGEAMEAPPAPSGRIQIFDVEVRYAADAPLKRRFLVRAVDKDEAERKAVAFCGTSPLPPAPLKVQCADAGKESLGERVTPTELFRLLENTEALL